jgi:hypothetical protein
MSASRPALFARPRICLLQSICDRFGYQDCRAIRPAGSCCPARSACGGCCQVVGCSCTVEVCSSAALRNTLTLLLRSCFRHPSNANLMQQYSAASLSAVIPLLAHTSESTLVLLLETLEYAVRPNAPDVTDDLYSKVAQSVLQVWTRSANGLWMRCIPYVLSDTKWQNPRLAWQ